MRKIPHEMSLSAQRTQKLNEAKRSADELIKTSNTLLDRLGYKIGHSIRRDTLESIEALRQVMTKEDITEINTKANQLAERRTDPLSRAAKISQDIGPVLFMKREFILRENAAMFPLVHYRIPWFLHRLIYYSRE